MDQREPFYIAGGKVNWCSHYAERYGHSLKSENRVTIWSSNPIPGNIFRNDENSNSKWYMYPKVHGSIIHNSQNMEVT